MKYAHSKRIIILFLCLIKCLNNSGNQQGFTICTAADERFFVPMLNLIASIHHNSIQEVGEIAVFDLGLANHHRRFIASLAKVKVYDVILIHPELLTSLPSNSTGNAFRIGCNAWKPVILKQILEQHSYVLYLDPVCTVMKPLSILFDYIKEHGYLFFDADHSIRMITTQNIIDTFNFPYPSMQTILDSKGLMGSCQGLSSQVYKSFISPLFQLTKNMDLFKDDGSKPEGFAAARPDQALFSIYSRLCNFTILPRNGVLQTGGKRVLFNLNDYISNYPMDVEEIKQRLIIIKTTEEHISSYPYITGDTFRTYTNYILDKDNRSFEPRNVSTGDTIFVHNDYLEEFFNDYHPAIEVKYLLVTHNCHYSLPEKFASYLDDPKLIAWFGKNMIIKHPKAVCIPAGLANKYVPHGNITIYDEMIQLAQNKAFAKNKLLCLNFDASTCRDERGRAVEIVGNKSFCHVVKNKPYRNYLKDLAESTFVVSQRGSGIDCYRTWESLIHGSYPIDKDKDEVTEKLLEQKYDEFSHK